MVQPKLEERTKLPQRKPPLWALWAAVIAVLLCVSLLVVGNAYVDRWQADYLHHIAPTGDDEAVKGVSLTAQAMKHDDILVMYGSSELNFQDEFHPARLFAGGATGFTTYVVGSGYRQSIHNFMALGALDKELRGRRIVLFLSPSWFGRTISEKAYRKNFSLLQAYEFAFDFHLSESLRQRGARRMMELGPPATDDPVLRAALAGMARGSLWGKIKYGLVWPLGRTTLAFLRAKDRLDLVRYVNSHRLRPEKQLTGPTELPSWAQLLADAGAKAKAGSQSNPFGIIDDYYQKNVAGHLDEIKDSAINETWLTSSEYGDFQLVLSELKEIQAKPLFISLPVMGGYYDFKGHMEPDRQAYYAKVRQMIEAAGFPVVDFGDREYEPGFMRDPWHPGWKGSVYIAQALDQFYHGVLPQTGH